MDLPDQWLAELHELCRRTPEQFALPDGPRIAHLVNKLDDWLAMGNPLPRHWDPTVNVQLAALRAARESSTKQTHRGA